MALFGTTPGGGTEPLSEPLSVQLMVREASTVLICR
jgi:hypothetical protein